MLLFDDIININNFDPSNIKIIITIFNYYLLHCICDDQKFEIGEI